MKGEDAVIELKKKLDEIYEGGRASTIAESELEEMLSSINPEKFKPRA